MKRVLALLTAIMLLVGMLAGCGGSSSGGTTQPRQTEPTEPPREVAQTSSHKAAESFAGGTGTETDPFQISEAGHLVLLHELLKKEEEGTTFDYSYVNGYYVLTADISLNDTSDFDNWSTNAPEYGWEPIGMGVILNEFAGVLDGAGHKITGMFIDADGDQTETYKDYYGLFSEICGTVKNLTVEQSYIRVSGGTAQAGTIAGDTYEAVVENCSANTVIELYETNSAGGITGSGGSVTGCSFSGNITQLDEGFAYIGGIANIATVTDCIFTGTLSGKGYTGGIIGYGGNAKDCVNRGSVSGETAGGISGRIYAAGTKMEIETPQRAIVNCTNEGQVTGTALAGGIVGWMGNDESDISMSVINCENKGQVNCDEAVAGIIGKLSVERTGMMKIENCVNHVDITGKGNTGGIIWDVHGAILHQEGDVVISGCKNLGNVTAESLYSAGIITHLMVMGDETDLRLTVQNCTNEGAIQSQDCAGGILGFSNVGFNAEVSAGNMTISDATRVCLRSCTNSGSITVKTSNSIAGGIAGVLGLGYISTEITDCVNTGALTVDFSLTDEQIEESQGLDWPEFYQIAGGIVGRIGSGIKLTTGEAVETSADNVNTANGNIVISGCRSTGVISAPDYSFILNKWEHPLYVNYLGGVVGQCSATDGYAFQVTNCTYSGADRGLGDTDYPDFGTKGA